MKIFNFIFTDPYLAFLFICICFIIIYSIYHLIFKNKGSWSSYYFTDIKSRDAPYRKKKQQTIKAPRPDSKGETECRRVLQEIFNRPFDKIRPDFLRNNVTSDEFSKRNLEIDCYNAELRLGVEYSGVQHYNYIPFFHKNREAFRNQKYRDEIKKMLCEKNGITLIDVPHTVEVPDIKSYLIKELHKRGFIRK
jgi:hypothetical protein